MDEGEISLWVTGSSQAQASSLRMASSVLMHKLLCCWSQYAYVGDSLTTWKCVRKSQRQNDRRPMVLSHNHDCKTSDKSQAPENRHTIQLLKEYFAHRTKITKKKLWAQSVLVMRAVIAQVLRLCTWLLLSLHNYLPAFLQWSGSCREDSFFVGSVP